MVGDQIIQWLKDHDNDAEEPRQSPPTMCHLLADVYMRVEGYDKTIIANAINVIACMDAGFDRFETYQFQPIDYSQKDKAPFDGTVLLSDGYNSGEGFWNSEHELFEGTLFDNAFAKNPTHWMPVPEFMKGTP